jgi:hypothetical protein
LSTASLEQGNRHCLPRWLTPFEWGRCPHCWTRELQMMMLMMKVRTALFVVTFAPEVTQISRASQTDQYHCPQRFQSPCLKHLRLRCRSTVRASWVQKHQRPRRRGANYWPKRASALATNLYCFETVSPCFPERILRLWGVARRYRNAPTVIVCDDLDQLVPDGGQDGQNGAARETTALGLFFQHPRSDQPHLHAP